jgi:hypothetical protein
MIRASDKPARRAAAKLLLGGKTIASGTATVTANQVSFVEYGAQEIPKKHRAKSCGALKAGWR